MSFHFSDGQSEVSGDFSKIEALIADLKEKHFTDIGVFGTGVYGNGKSIAEVGAYNEFGSITRPDHPPKRSFIRMPLETQGDKIAQYVEKHAKEHLEDGDVKAIFEDIGIAGESVIHEAFSTRGFGTWKPNAPSTIRQKKGGDTPLIGVGDDAGLLQAAITHRTE